MPSSTSLPGLSGRENTFRVRTLRVCGSSTAKSANEPPMSTPILRDMRFSRPALLADLLVPRLDPLGCGRRDVIEREPDRLLFRCNSWLNLRQVLHVDI